MGNAALALAFLEELEATGQQQIETLEILAARRDAVSVAEAAHSLKGAAGIIGAEPLRMRAAALEAAGDSGSLDLLADSIADLRREMARCLAEIPLLRERMQHEGR